MKRHIILLNDVNTEDDRPGVSFFSKDSVVSKIGQQQSLAIAKYLLDISLDMIVASTACSISRLLHNLRQRGGKPLSTSTGSSVVMKSIPVYYSEELNDRDFGVLNGTIIPPESDIFKHSRVCAEGGESIEQCRLRSFSCVRSYLDKYPDKNIAFVSHQNVCQILFNVLSNQSITHFDELWKFKGTYADFESNNISNTLTKFYNILHHLRFQGEE